MNAAEIFKWLDARPFRPFVIELVSGAKIRVFHPENVAVVPSRANVSFFAVFQTAGQVSQEHEFEPQAAARITRARGNGARSE